MSHWSLRTEELQEPHSRHVLLQSLIFVLEDSEPDLLTLVRKMVEMIDEAEGELEREKANLQDVIDDLEDDLAEAELQRDEAELAEARWRELYDEAKYDAQHWEAEAVKLQEAVK